MTTLNSILNVDPTLSQIKRLKIMQLILLYLVSSIIFFAIDLVWLGLVAKPFYDKELSAFLSPQINWLAAAIFYSIYIAGLIYFAILPAIKTNSLSLALINGAILGFLCYATYDLTNLATLHKWPLKIVIVDIIWGTVLTGSVSALSFWVAQRLLKF